MLQKTYSVYTGDYENITLFIETGKQFLSCWCKNNETNKVTGFELFQLDDVKEDSFERTLNSVKQLSVLIALPATTTNFLWNSSEAICIPSQLYDEALAADYISLAHGDYPHIKTYSKSISDIEVLAAANDKLQQIAVSNFPAAIFVHHHYAILSGISKSNEPTIYLYFYPGSFTVAAYKYGKLQLIQSREFTKGEDVLYFILNVYKQYDFVQEETALYTAGFVDAESSLYQLLYQYIAGIQLQQPHENLFATDIFKEYRQHIYLPFVHYHL